MQKSGMYNYLDVGEMKSWVYNCMDHMCAHSMAWCPKALKKLWIPTSYVSNCT